MTKKQASLANIGILILATIEKKTICLSAQNHCVNIMGLHLLKNLGFSYKGVPKMRWIKLFSFFVFFYGSLSFAAKPQIITLQDGSSVSGQVLSLSGGVYQIKTQSMGTVQVQQSQVVSIRSVSITSTNSESMTIDPARLQQVLRAIVTNPQTMQSIQALQNDPQFQAVLNNPQIMQAIQSGNWGALAQNPKIQQLTNHSAVKNISRQMGQ